MLRFLLCFGFPPPQLLGFSLKFLLLQKMVLVFPWNQAIFPWIFAATVAASVYVSAEHPVFPLGFAGPPSLET